jgi:hypothetical protein
MNDVLNPANINTSNETLNNLLNTFDIKTSNETLNNNGNTKETTKSDGNFKKTFPLVLDYLKDLLNKSKLFKFDNIDNKILKILPPQLREPKLKKYIEKIYNEFKVLTEKGLIKIGELHGGKPENILATEIINNGGGKSIDTAKEIVETFRDKGENIKNKIAIDQGNIMKQLKNVWANDIIPFISTAFGEFSRRITILEKLFQQSSEKGKQSWKNDALNNIKNFFVDFGNVLYVVGKYLIDIIYSLFSLLPQIMSTSGYVMWSLVIFAVLDFYFKWGILAAVCSYLYDKLLKRTAKAVKNKLPQCMKEAPEMIRDDLAFVSSSLFSSI